MGIGRFSIRARFVLVVFACFGVLLVALLWLLQSVYQTEMQMTARHDLIEARRGLQSLVERDTAMLSSVLDTILINEDIRAAFAEGDRKRLGELTVPLLKHLDSSYGVTHLLFIEPDRRVLLRAHEPGEHGDKLGRATVRVARRTKSYGAGLDLGVTAFALRVAHPVYSEPGSGQDGAVAGDPTSRLIGYVEVGEEIDHLLTEIQQVTGDQVVLLFSKSKLDHDAWAVMREATDLPDNWADHEGFVVAGTTDPDLEQGLELIGGPEQLTVGGELLDVSTRDDGRMIAAGALPLVDANGDVSGAVYLESDLTSRSSVLRSAQLRIALLSVLTALVITVIFIALLNRMVFSRLGAMAGRLREHEGRSVARTAIPSDAPPVRNDEIGEFESAFERYWEELEVKSVLLDEASDSVILHDLGGRILYANRAASLSRGYTPEEFLDMQLDSVVTDESADEIDFKMERLLEDGEAIFESEDLMKDGTAVPVEVHARVIEVDDKKLIASVVRDLTERRESERVIERLAYHDSLTGLANRELFQNHLSMALARMRRSGGSLGVAFIDLDRLKNVNDSLGHSAGDEVISIIGDRLSAAVREGDTVARIGGDEFLLLLLDVDEESSAEVGDRIIEALRPEVIIGTHRIRVTASVGLVFCEGGSDSAETLVRRADLAMYSAKRNGGDRHCVHVDRMGSDAREQFELQDDLVRAIAEHEISLHYQPIVSVPTGLVTGVEVLLRWEHPRRGAVPPSAFVPLAEECGLIVQLGEWTLREACRQARSWLDEGIELGVCVNVSTRQLLNSDTAASVASLLKETGLPARLLELEISETAAARQSPQVHQSLLDLREQGVRLSIDDFGMGYSSLSRASDLGVDALKVDRSFVERMDRHPESWAIVKAIVSLGHRLGLKTVAEGVETLEQFELLRTMGCDEAQGFHFSAAVPGSQIPDLVRARAKGAAPDAE